MFKRAPWGRRDGFDDTIWPKGLPLGERFARRWVLLQSETWENSGVGSTLQVRLINYAFTPARLFSRYLTQVFLSQTVQSIACFVVWANFGLSHGMGGEARDLRKCWNISKLEFVRSERKIFAVDAKDIFCPTAIFLEQVTPLSAFETRRLPFETRSLPYVVITLLTRRVWQSFKFAPFPVFLSMSKVGLPLMDDIAGIHLLPAHCCTSFKPI